MRLINKKSLFLLLAMSIGSSAFAQTESAEPPLSEPTSGVAEAESPEVTDVLILPPLFEFPVAPEDMDWTNRSNWLAEHFWDGFDFKQKSVGQSQLVHAFSTYILPLHIADKSVALKGVKDLIKKLQKNPTLMYQFLLAAERTMYEPMTAELLIDEVYLEFLKAVVANKKLPSAKKVRYQAQLKSLQNSIVGKPLFDFLYTDRQGSPSKYTATGVPTIIQFGDFDCSDCRISRLRLETDDELQQLVDEGKACIMFINPNEDNVNENWTAAVKNYPKSWKLGHGSTVSDFVDMRITPCIYVIDAKGNLVSKSANTEKAKEYVKNNVSK